MLEPCLGTQQSPAELGLAGVEHCVEENSAQIHYCSGFLYTTVVQELSYNFSQDL